MWGQEPSLMKRSAPVRKEPPGEWNQFESERESLSW